MRKRIYKILITGGAGFMGSAFVRSLCKNNFIFGKEIFTIVLDKLTYAGDLMRLKEVEGRYRFYKVDICNRKKIENIFRKEKPAFIVNFAAETHVDKSIQNPLPFFRTNVLGTQILLDLSRKYKVKKFLHISTDEVYGDIIKGKFKEDSVLNPSSPYAASKAAADLLIKSYIRTYKFPAIIIRPCNNYGPWQYPEKLIPRAILSVLKGTKIPIYGKGKNIREWLYVEDCASGILEIFKKGKIGEIYNLGSNEEKTNIEVAKEILRLLGKETIDIQFIQDRPGHDVRYRLDTQKLNKIIGWQPKIKFSTGLKLTLDWFMRNKNWLFSKIKCYPE